MRTTRSSTTTVRRPRPCEETLADAAPNAPRAETVEAYHSINAGYWKLFEQGKIDSAGLQSGRWVDLFRRMGLEGDPAAAAGTYISRLSQKAHSVRRRGGNGPGAGPPGEAVPGHQWPLAGPARQAGPFGNRRFVHRDPHLRGNGHREARSPVLPGRRRRPGTSDRQAPVRRRQPGGGHRRRARRGHRRLLVRTRREAVARPRGGSGVHHRRHFTNSSHRSRIITCKGPGSVPVEPFLLYCGLTGTHRERPRAILRERRMP